MPLNTTFQEHSCRAVTNQTESSCVCFLTRLLYLWFTVEDSKDFAFTFSRDCSLFDSRLRCIISVMEKRNQYHFKQSHWILWRPLELAEHDKSRPGIQTLLKNKGAGNQWQDIQIFSHVYTQATWKFALGCLGQVKTTEQRRMKCRMRKKGHSIALSWVYVKVFQNNQ